MQLISSSRAALAGEAVLSVRIKKAFVDNKQMAGSHFALDVEFEAQPGITILFGPSGSGKTATIKAIAGIIRPDSGRICVGDHILFDSERNIDLPIRKRGVGLVFQHLALFPHMSALENIEFAINHLPRSQRLRCALELMERFKIAHTAPRRPAQISGGEAQRVALARALAANPRLLLLDEPLSAIDEATKSDIIADLKVINRELRLPVIYVTHNRDEAITLGERLIAYEQGRVLAAGEPIEIFGAPLVASVARLTGVENIFTGQVVGKSEVAGTMTVLISSEGGSCLIDVPLGRQRLGDRVTVAVRSGDILLATEQPRSTSARNVLPGRITAIEDRSDRVLVRVSSGVNWVVSTTRQSVSELALWPGQSAWLAIKTHSFCLLDQQTS
jgi:molybdate transport system ATP-binding protein